MSFCATCNQQFKTKNFGHIHSAKHLKKRLSIFDNDGVKTKTDFTDYMRTCMILIHKVNDQPSIKAPFFCKMFKLLERYSDLLEGKAYEKLMYKIIDKYEEVEIFLRRDSNGVFFKNLRQIKALNYLKKIDIAKIKLKYHLKINSKFIKEITLKFAYMNINRMIFEDRKISEDLQRLVDKFL
jgi:hypothetical protein